MAEAADAGLVDGLTIPIFDPGGAQGCATLAGRAIDPRTDVRRAIHTVALFAYAAAERLFALSRRARLEPLSPREKEVLTWIATGRTRAEIAERLGIALPTVDVHLRNARTKLGTANTLHTAVVALQRRDIRL